MPPSFNDHFSSVAAGYARYRPGYPPRLFDWLAEIAPARQTVWDCATGSGQAAVVLGEYFERVIATDASSDQIASARPHPHVLYRVAPAEQSGLDDTSIDLVTVATAVHWFDRSAFYNEVRRVLRPGGAVVVWCYDMIRFDSSSLTTIVDDFYARTVGPYWPPERRLVEERYTTIDFPFDEIATPDFSIISHLTLDDLIGYVYTWSAVSRYIAERGEDPVPQLREVLEAAWGDPAQTQRTVSPLALRAGRVA